MALNYSPNITVTNELITERDCKYILAKDSLGNAVLVDLENIFRGGVLTHMTDTAIDWNNPTESNKLITLAYLNEVMNSDEYRLAFQGLQGYVGLQGAQGIAGANFTGSGGVGKPGPQGYTGVQGIQGIQGIKATYSSTAQGFRGPQGAQGSKGTLQGLQGKAGYVGTLKLGTDINTFISGLGISTNSTTITLNNCLIYSDSKITASHFYES